MEVGMRVVKKERFEEGNNCRLRSSKKEGIGCEGSSDSGLIVDNSRRTTNPVDLYFDPQTKE
ncbi:uncharacterized protein N7473_010121 [Penicillium subrubescens]|uniref:uncharacterized protein n=1 Tax=Penicillium subrubescens TaxID=1316194 RepID=UPI0025459953|nr:uncharacterized protein N7473_010121 [Penicillium subrubescens]KAJ5883235.1 hypothetical protein N7473_010121 [Penicillium subrubescens]